MNFSTAWLTTNRNCNNKCQWCYAKKFLEKNTLMDFEEAKRAVDLLKKKNICRIILIGGEPTIYPNFLGLAKYIRQNNIYLSVASNGRAFNNLDFAKQTVETGINKIDISLKGLSEKEYLDNTGSNNGFEEMLEGYHNLKKIHFSPSVSYVIVSDDCNKFDNLIKFIQKEKITRLSLQFVKPVVELTASAELFPLDRMGAFVSYVYNQISMIQNIDYCIEISFPLCLIEKEILNKLLIEHRIVNCCHVPRGSGINIDENFKIIPCNHFADFPFSEKSINCSDDYSIEKIMESSIVKEFRYKSRTYPALKCRTCDLWKQCGGGCFTRWLSIDPNKYIN